MTVETKGKLRVFWDNVRGWAFKYIGGLFMEEKNGDGKKVISIGRCMLIAVLAWMFVFWGHWVTIITITPEALALLIVANLPEGSTVSGVDVLAASKKVVDALPSSAPPLLGDAFFTAGGYVFGTKAVKVASGFIKR